MYEEGNEWIEKAISLLDKHKLYEKQEEIVWQGALSMIFSEFCRLSNDDPIYSGIIEAMDETGFCEDEYVLFAKEYNIGLSLTHLEEFMSEHELESLTLQNYEEALAYYIDEIKEDVDDILYSKYNRCKKLLYRALNHEFGSSNLHKVLFFYVKEGQHEKALQMYDGLEDLTSLSLTLYADNYEDNDQGMAENHVLYNFVDNFYSLSFEQALRVYEWTECAFN